MNKQHKDACGLHCLQVSGLSVTLGGKTILKDVDLHAHCGELTAIIGRNGAGKSTLMKALVGEYPFDGTVSFSGHGGVPTAKKPRLGYVPQSLAIDRHSPVTVKDMMLCYTSRLPVFLPRSKKTTQSLKDHLAMFGADALLDAKIGDLSGGELQRVLLALAVFQKPDLVLFDEPVSGIDNEGLSAFYGMIEDLRKQDMITLLISHDLSFVRAHADRVVLLENGSVAASGKAAQVFSTTAFSQAFPAQSQREVTAWT